MDARWKHPFTCIVAGPTGCGISTFVTHMLRHAAAMIAPPPPPRTDQVVLRRMARGLRNDGLSRRAVRGRVAECEHVRFVDEDTSVLYLVQNLFPKNKESRNISLNSQYMVVFKNPSDASQMSHLARQMYPGRFKRLLKTPRRYRTAIYWSISNRTRPRTCVCARPSFQTTVFSTCTCRRYKKIACESLHSHHV